MRSERGLDRLALAAAVATFFLLTIGGFVTSLDAGMVFLDWPLSNGSINPDGWLFDPKTATEHGHRTHHTFNPQGVPRRRRRP
jgi:cytochrome c oxidase assembly protein subunit 15